MTILDQEMEAFKQEVREDLRVMTKSITSLSNSVQVFVTKTAVDVEKENQQKEINKNLLERVGAVEKSQMLMQLERAQEKPSRDFIYKFWPYLLVVSTLMIGVISAFASTFGKSLLG